MIKASKDRVSRESSGLNETGFKGIIIHVSSKGQITLPKIIREQLHIKEGDLLRLQRHNSEIIIKRVKLVPEEEFSNEEWKKLEKLAKAKGKTFSKAEDFLKKLQRM